MIWQVELAAAPAETPEQIAGLRHRLSNTSGSPATAASRTGCGRTSTVSSTSCAGPSTAGGRPTGASPRGRGDARGAAPGRPGWGGVGAARLASSLASRARDANLELLGAFSSSRRCSILRRGAGRRAVRSP
ncbi:MAG: hypothetical protein R3D25_15125 [Geminicoccaceae bacterium]